MIIQALVEGIIAGRIHAVIALNLRLIYRSIKFFHFAHGVSSNIAKGFI